MKTKVYLINKDTKKFVRIDNDGTTDNTNRVTMYKYKGFKEVTKNQYENYKSKSKDMTQEKLILKALDMEVVRTNLTRSQMESLIKYNTRKNFDKLTVKKNHRKLLNMIRQTALNWQETRSQKDIKSMIITIDWKRASMGAMQSKATASIIYKDGRHARVETARTGGYGYDKESTSFSQLFNDVLRNKVINKRKQPPYGLTLKSGYYLPYFGYGVGVSCYFRIVGYMGGNMKTLSYTDTVTVYEVKF